MILAGGTGGHVFPALATAEELRARGCEVVWMGTKTGLEARVAPAAGIPMAWLEVSGIRGKGWAAKLKAPLELLLACLRAGQILRREKPDVVLGMGGFVSGPGGLMAKLLGIPLVVHEQNRIPGTTNRLLVKWAQSVLEAFPGSFPAKAGARCVGNPLRASIIEAMRGNKAPSESVPRILVFGGSQGAQALNEIVPQALKLTGLELRVRHQTGAAMEERARALYRELGLEAETTAFIEDMAGAYAWADLAICRAGAMTLSELTLAALPSVLIPYPYAIDDHQTANARCLADAGAATLMPQTRLTPENLAETLKRLLTDPRRLAAMARAAHTLAKPDAARQVADICLAEAGA
jgi:UDP-N-acetylglucosamine--N-acetylmuramyl-(pentapeptide) pyrophosphoryl-undecaprenol N-acetylglucosamine transferase